MSFFELKLIQIKFKFLSADVIFLSEVCHIRSKSDHKSDLNAFARKSEKYNPFRKLLYTDANHKTLRKEICSQLMNI